MFNITSNPIPLSSAPVSPFSNLEKINRVVDTFSKCFSAAAPAIEYIAVEHTKTQHRRTDEEFRQEKSGTSTAAKEFQCQRLMPLSAAINHAENSPGVYVLYLNGEPMKCGRAAYEGGVAWRLKQYYNLNYDDRARNGDCWSVTKKNRDSIVVSWQCCPAAKCQELEYKLFQKYGKGKWAKRAPASCGSDSWDLLI